MGERVIERTLELDASIETVWRAITDPAEIAQWFGDKAELDLRKGGEGAWTWENHGRFAVRVEEVHEPNRLVWSWTRERNVAYDASDSTTVEWNLSARDDGGTTLHLRESGFRSDEHHGQNSSGWTSELGDLRAFLGA